MRRKTFVPALLTLIVLSAPAQAAPQMTLRRDSCAPAGAGPSFFAPAPEE